MSKLNVKEYKVKLAKQDKENVKKYHLMRFRPPHQVDLANLVSPTLDRQRETAKGEETPTHGEGSEFGKKRREEARKRRYGVVSKKGSPDDQPWELKEQKKGGKHFLGRKEGGVNSNSAYYMLTHCQDGTFEALPIEGWYDFVPTIKYNYLDAEEAEKKFEQRHKTLNYFSVMLSKKVQSKEDDETKPSELLISDIARGRATAASSDSDSDDNHKAVVTKSRKKSQSSAKKRKKKAGEEEDSDSDDRTTDEGELESREVDYITDSSGPSSDEQRNDKEAEHKQQQKKQVGEALVSDSSLESSEEELDEAGKAIQALMKKHDDNSSDSDEAEEIDAMDQSQFLSMKNSKDGSSSKTATSSTKSSVKRDTKSLEATAGSSEEPAAKKLKLSTSTTTITVDEVKYYLMRKPITATDLAKKFRSKKTDMDKMKIIERLGEIIQKKLNVERKTIQGKTYLSMKET